MLGWESAMCYGMRYDRNMTYAAMVRDGPIIPGSKNIAFDNGVKIAQPVPVFDFVIDANGQGRPTDYLWTTMPITLSARFNRSSTMLARTTWNIFPFGLSTRFPKACKAATSRPTLWEWRTASMRKSRRLGTSPPLAGKSPSILEIVCMVWTKIASRGRYCSARTVGVRSAWRTKKSKAARKAQLTGVVFVPATGYVYP